MKTPNPFFAGAIAGLLTLLAGASAPAADSLATLEKNAQEALDQFKRADSGLSNVLAQAAGYAIFPSVGKGGFVIGAARGEGLVYEKGQLIGRATLTQVTVGAQIGGQELSELLLFETATALGHFKESKMAMSAQVSAVAAAEGASKNAKYVDGVMVFTRAKTGLMAEASIGGQKFKFEPIKK
jgi:lipid-binding SYLF domain-containing protein